MRRWKAETVFRNVVASIFLLTGQFIRTEKHTSQGRIDSVVETPEHVYIFEFKVDKPVEVALEQIERNGYAQSYATDSPHPPQNRCRLLHQNPHPLRLARSARAGGQSPLICRAALDRGNCPPPGLMRWLSRRPGHFGGGRVREGASAAEEAEPSEEERLSRACQSAGGSGCGIWLHQGRNAGLHDSSGVPDGECCRPDGRVRFLLKLLSGRTGKTAGFSLKKAGRANMM